MRSLLFVGFVLCAFLFQLNVARSHITESPIDEENNQVDESDETEEVVVCGNVTGWWRNRHGSDVYLKLVGSMGRLEGRYLTAVETSKGSAGNKPVRVSGSVEQSLITFHASWRNGGSMATWIGQCHRVNGRFVIETSWILKSKVDDCDDHWLSNRFGQETFVRSSGPDNRDTTERQPHNF